jgi:hypothetical protein
VDFSTELDKVQQHLTDARSAAQAAATESRDKLKQRIDKAQTDMNAAAKDAQQQADKAAAGARTQWARMTADAAAAMGDVKARMDKRATELDARALADEADWAEADARDAIEFAVVSVDNARLAILEAVAVRAHAEERARAARA